MHNWTIYMYTFPNDKKYIGATTRPLHIRQGSYESGWSKYKNCRLIWEAIQEFGVDNIKQTILFQGEISDEKAADMEKYYIALYKTNANRYKNPSFGYNLGNGGEGTQKKHITEERRKALAEQMRLQGFNNIGKTASDETRNRQRMAKLGTKRGSMSEETKRKIGLANSLEMISAETRRRKSEAFSQPIMATNPETGERLFFSSGMETAEYFDAGISTVSAWVNGKKKPKNGYIFEKVRRDNAEESMLGDL